MIYVFTALNIGLVIFGIYEERKLRAKVREYRRIELKYQRHLQNAFDYQIQMYAFMQAHDAEGFKLASEQVSEELNKCEEILKRK